MSTLCHLVRHGDYALLGRALGGREPYPLSAQGRTQAERVAAVLQPRPVAAVLTSPVQRARDTAGVIAARLNLDPCDELAFTEIDYAGWTGRDFAALDGDAAWQAWNDFRSTAGVPGGETMLAVQARAVAAIVQHATRYTGGELVVVSHADVIKAMLAHWLGMPLDLLRRLEIAPACISQVRLSRDDATILAINA